MSRVIRYQFQIETGYSGADHIGDVHKVTLKELGLKEDASNREIDAALHKKYGDDLDTFMTNYIGKRVAFGDEIREC